MKHDTLPPSERIRSKGGYFTRRPVHPGDLPGIMSRHIATGTMGSAWSTLITGIIYVYFGNAIGLTRLQWGILSGLSAWVVIVQPLGTMLGEMAGSRKLVWFWTALTDRILRLAGIVGAFLLWRAGNHYASLFFMAGICVGTLVGSLSPGPWYGWLSTIIPPDVHGTFWGRRDSWISLVVIVVSLPSGLLMDLVPPGGKLEMATVILVAVSLVGFTDIIIHGTLPEPPRVGPEPRGSFSGILSPLRDHRFRPWLVFTGCWNFSQSLAGTLATLYFMENLGFKNNLLGGLIAVSIVSLLGTLLAARKVGRMVDRYGIKKMLMLGYSFWAFIPAIWLFAVPGTALFWVGLASLVGGIFSAAANNAGVKLATRFHSHDESGMSMAVSTMVGSVANGLAAIAAGIFLDAMGQRSFMVLGLAVSAFPLLFIVSTLMRVTTVFTLLPRVRVAASLPPEEQVFLLPLFFESLPGIIRRAAGAVGEEGRRKKARRPR